MLINIKDLQIGDEIILGSNSNLKYLKVLSSPTIKHYKGWHRIIDPITKQLYWDNTGICYKSFRCSIRQDTIPYKLKNGKDANYKKYVFEPDISKHNKRISIDLGGRDIYLVKREQQ